VGARVEMLFDDGVWYKGRVSSRTEEKGYIVSLLSFFRRSFPPSFCLPHFPPLIFSQSFFFNTLLFDDGIQVTLPRVWYGVATVSRLLKMIGLFCKRAL